MLRLKSQWFDCNDRDKHVIMTGEPGRIHYLDYLHYNAGTGTRLYLWINDIQIFDIDLIHQIYSDRMIYYVLEWALLEGDTLSCQQWKEFPGGDDVEFAILYHDLPPDIGELPESYPYPTNPNVPPYPYIPVPPTPPPVNDIEPPEPPYPPDPPYPPWPPFPPFPPIDPDVYKDYVPPDYEIVPDFKPAIPISILKKNALVSAPYITSRLRLSFLGDSSFAQRSKLSLDYQKTFSHLMAEGIFQTVPLRATETAQLITTNVKDDYKVLSYTHTDADYHDYWFELPFTHLTLKTVSDEWNLKILTVYKWLCRFMITDMDELTLAVDTTSYFPFYAVGISLKCATASGGSPKTITGMIEF